ncbi:MAG: hypothetical protein ILP10_06950, partial [Lachnospiraceae bacterium]|nr:hypothetical protein [Lachnospiraceae bacterium]
VLKLAGDAAVISSEALASYHPLIQREIVRDLLGRVAGRLKDITAAHVAEVAELAGAQSGKSVSLPYGMVARNDFGKITIKVYHGEGEPRKYGHIEYCVKDRDADIPVPKNDCIKWFDYDKIVDGVETRTLRDGDYIRVKKQGGDGLGKKLVRDVLMELKVPTPEREKVPLLASGSHVLWIGGMRGSDDLRVDSGTKRVLEAVYVEEADRR